MLQSCSARRRRGAAEVASRAALLSRSKSGCEHRTESARERLVERGVCCEHLEFGVLNITLKFAKPKGGVLLEPANRCHVPALGDAAAVDKGAPVGVTTVDHEALTLPNISCIDRYAMRLQSLRSFEGDCVTVRVSSEKVRV